MPAKKRKIAAQHRLLLALLIALPAPSFAAPARHWTATWGSSQLKPSASDTLPRKTFEGASLRQVVHLSLGGTTLRLHLSNVFGESPLVLRSVHVARGPSGKQGTVEPVSDTVVRFHGQTTVSIPEGAEYLSDPIAINAPPLSDLTVTMVIEHPPETLTFHAGSRATSFLLPGDHASDPRFDAPQTLTHWYFLAGVEVETHGPSAAVVTLGDSITDGRGSTTDANDRWPDRLAARLVSKHLGIVNQGIGGNRILADGLGPNALARFDRDVLAIPAVRFLIVFEGINDLGTLDRLEEHPQAAHDALVAQLQSAFQQMVERAHAHGIRVLAGTITPDRGSDYYHPSDRSEADRQRLNHWIRTSGIFDGIVDFDALLRDPAHPDRLAPQWDSGDHLHPGPAGYKHMGEAIPLSLFQQSGASF